MALIRHKKSETTSGWVSTDLTVGRGRWRLFNVRVTAGEAATPPQQTSIMYREKQSDGSLLDSYIANGLIATHYPLIWTGETEVQGPGYFRAYVNHLASTYHGFTVSYRSAD